MAAQKAEAERVRQEAMARFAEDTRLAALTVQARKARTLAYKRELDATMAQRQALFEQQLVRPVTHVPWSCYPLFFPKSPTQPC